MEHVGLQGGATSHQESEQGDDCVANNVNVVNRGFEYIAQYMANTSNNTTNNGWTVPTIIGWGTANGSNATTVQLPASAPSTTIGTGQWFDVAPYFEAPEARTSGTVSVINNSNGSGSVTTQVVGTITCAQAAGESIGESFLVFSTTKPAASSVATGNMTAAQTSMTVASNTFPAPTFYVQVDNEVIQVSATAASNVFSTIARAQNGSAAAAHNQNAGVTLGNIPGAAAAVNHGDLFAHAGFVALALNNGDSVQFTWQVNVTS